MQQYLDLMNRVAGHYRNQIESVGLELRHSSNFFQLLQATGDMGFEMTPHFSPHHNAFFRDEAFWVGIYDEGECVGTVACKRQPIGAENLADYTKRSWQRYYEPGSTNPVIFAEEQKPFLMNTTGNLCYCGEYRVKPDFQKKGIGHLLAAYIKPAAWTCWPDTDLFYIFMENRDVRSGLMAAIELSTQIRNALQWEQHPSQAKRDYWLGAEDRHVFLGWLMDEVRTLAAPVAKKSQGKETPSASGT
jgi:hypothetical protein